jgi:hypothetical protein
MGVTTDNKVGVTPSSTAKDYPSLEVYKYTVDAKGNVTTTLILNKKESGNIRDLGKPEKPIKEGTAMLNSRPLLSVVWPM